MEVPMTSHKELRECPRIPVGFHATASWEDRQSRRRSSAGTCINISESGLGLQLRDAVPGNSRIRVQVPSLPLFGTGKVRHCERLAGEYRIGIELSASLPAPLLEQARATIVPADAT